MAQITEQHHRFFIEPRVECRLWTAIVSMITSNPRRASDVGNVALEAGEGGLPKPSVVKVSQVLTVDKAQLTDHLGVLRPDRIRQILDGLYLSTEPRELPR